MKDIRRKGAALLALVLMVSSLPMTPVSAEESQVALRIERAEFSPEEVANLVPYGGFDVKIQRAKEDIAAIQEQIDAGGLSEQEITKKQNDIRQKEASIASWEEEMAKPENQRIVPVSVQISGNGTGFLASEFGITYDARLKLRDIQREFIGDVFQYTSNEDEHLIWFSGASSMGSEVASRDKATIMTLYFQLPEYYNANDQYAVNFSWEGHSKPAFWYSDQGVNDIDVLKGNSHNGQIWLPSSDSARLNEPELQLNQGNTSQLEVKDVSGSCYWISGDNSIATVSPEGLVTAVKPGVTTVYCITSTGQTLTCEVTVTTYYYYVLQENDFTPVSIHSSSQVVYLEYPSAPAGVLWFSSNPAVATVEDGRVKGISEGTSIITAICNGVAFMKSVVVDFSSSTSEPTTDPEPTETEPETTTTTETTTTETTTTETTPEPTTEPATTVPTETTTMPPVPITYGDIDNDSDIDIVDVLYLNQALLGVVDLNQTQSKAGDVYADGFINDKDSLTLLKYIVRIIESIPYAPESY